MNNDKNNGPDDQNNQNVSQAVKLAVIGAAIATVGDAISTIAAILALEDERQEQSEKADMQKQIDYLTTELEKLKNQGNNPKKQGLWFK
ncbi:hypothetical protein MHH81_08060 [Psychrobacillus sp. FSL H8-0484]|uniref:hypothetical protein n=1 Tax=Psychrobacillus sp. FSL H8-0484 TaxID=2921390 RepID=UPI0030F61D2B